MATYSNSPLVNYTKISPNKNKTRKHETHNPNGVIDRITIHHVAGNASVESIGAGFAPVERQASSNYGIGTDGRVGLYVDEKHRPWTSGSAANDYRAVTIEVSNDSGAPNWHVSDKALDKLIELCVDICKRNGIKKLNYTGDTTGNLTMHKWFQATGCPGPYLESKFPYIAEMVNIKLGVIPPKPAANTTGLKVGEQIKLADNAVYTSGKSIPAWVRKSPLYVRDINGEKITFSLLKIGVITGVVDIKYIVSPSKAPVSNSTTVEFIVGDKVKLVAGAKYTSGKSIPDFVFNAELYVRAINGDNITISTLQSGAITGVVKASSLVLCNAVQLAPEPYLVRVTVDALNIRSGAGTGFAIVGCIRDRSVYTIIEEKNGWGKLKSEAGWISLQYTKKV